MIYSPPSTKTLIEIETNSLAVTAGTPKEKFVYTYDFYWRKIRSEHFVWDVSADDYALYSTNKRYYDNWNLIYETIEYTSIATNPNGTPKSSDEKKYYYGEDLLRSLYNTGGTGGLRMLEINGIQAFAFNNIVGSIEALFSTDSNSSDDFEDNNTSIYSLGNPLTLASYEYTPFAVLVNQTGILSSLNSVHYSTRYSEPIVNLFYYGYRHYSPKLMKWLSKEPLGEGYNRNLFNFVINNPASLFDSKGDLQYTTPIYNNAASAVANMGRRVRGGKNFKTDEVEVCGVTCERCINGVLEYVSVFVKQGTAEGCSYFYSKKICGSGKVVSYWHTHPLGAGDSFSTPETNPPGKNDIDFIHSLAEPLPLFLINPAGILLEYNPTTRDITNHGNVNSIF